jgi:hypothetical protein
LTHHNLKSIISLNKNFIYTMKHIFKPIFVFLLLLSVGISSAQTQIPLQLHGYWQFKTENKGGWDGMHVGHTHRV